MSVGRDLVDHILIPTTYKYSGRMSLSVSGHISANLRRVFEKEHDALLRLAGRKLGNSEEAKDIVQEAFVRVATVRDQSIADPPAFLRTIVINLVRDHQRRRRTGDAELDLHAGQDPVEWVREHSPSAEHVIYQRQRLQAFEQAVKSLPARSREVFILRKLHGNTHDQIAARTGLSKAAIEKHLYRAMMACRDLMKDYD